MVLNLKLLFPHITSYSPNLTPRILCPNTQHPYPNDTHIPCTKFYHLRLPPCFFCGLRGPIHHVPQYLTACVAGTVLCRLVSNLEQVRLRGVVWKPSKHASMLHNVDKALEVSPHKHCTLHHLKTVGV